MQDAAGALACPGLPFRLADQPGRYCTCLTWQLASPRRPTFSRESWERLHSPIPLARSPLGYNKPRVAHVATARHWRASNYPRVNFRMTSAESSLDFQPRGDVPFPFCIKNKHVVSIPPILAHSHALFHTSFGVRGPPVCLGSSLASFETSRFLDCQHDTHSSKEPPQAPSPARPGIASLVPEQQCLMRTGSLGPAPPTCL